MKDNIANISGLALALTLAACGPNGELDDKSAPSETTAQSKSALSGGPWTWANLSDRRCLDSNAGGSVYALGCNGGSYQNWTNVPKYFGDEIVDQATRRCLDSNFDGSAYTLPCNGGYYQQWVVTYRGNGWEIRNVATQRCLEKTQGTDHVYTSPCDLSHTNQRWY